MKFLRGILKVAAVILWSIVLMPVAAFSFIGLDHWAKVRRGAFWASLWAKSSSFIVGVRTHVHGNIPKERGALLVSNHLGYLDILAHGSNFRIRFAPKAEIRRWFFAGWLVGLSSPVWIDRKNPRKAAEYAEVFRKTMENGVSLLVYPEGTSSDGKHGLLPFKSTAFASLSPGVPVLPMVLFYRETPSDGYSASWGDDTPFVRHVWRVLGLKRIDIDLYLLPEYYPSEGMDRKEIAQKVRELMTEEYEKHV